MEEFYLRLEGRAALFAWEREWCPPTPRFENRQNERTVQRRAPRLMYFMFTYHVTLDRSAIFTVSVYLNIYSHEVSCTSRSFL